MSFFTALCLVLPFLAFHVNAAIILARDVFDPQITYPQPGTVWHVGEIHNVTWDTSILPPNLTQTGMVVLGFLNDTENDGNEHLDLDHPLATNFQLIAGRVNITVPAVAPLDSYILILFGDSGNASPQFTITNVSISMPPSVSSSLPSSTAPASAPAPASASAPSFVPAPTSAPSPADGSSSTASSSPALVNPASPANNSPPPVSSTLNLGASTSSPNTPSSIALNSNSLSSPSTASSQNGIAQTNAASTKFVSFAILSLNTAIAVLLSNAIDFMVPSKRQA